MGIREQATYNLDILITWWDRGHTAEKFEKFGKFDRDMETSGALCNTVARPLDFHVTRSGE